MHDRHDLTDAEWALLEPGLPDRTPRRGGGWGGHRRVINGVLWRTRTGAGWRSCRRVRQVGRRCTTGIAAGQPTAPGNTSWTGCAPGATTIMVGRGPSDRLVGGPRAPRRRRRPPPATRRRARRPDARRPGGHSDVGPHSRRRRMTKIRPPTARVAGGIVRRSDGPAAGVSTKIHLLADTRARPLTRVVTAGQRGGHVGLRPAAGPTLHPPTRTRPAARPAGRVARRQGVLAPGRSAPSCDAAASARSSPNPPTRPPTSGGAGRPVGGPSV